MGNLIRVDFNSGKIIDKKEATNGYQGAHSLREISTEGNASREDLMEGTAYVAAHLEVAKTSQDRLEIQDLEITLSECMRALGPSISDAEVDAIFKRSGQIISDLTAN